MSKGKWVVAKGPADLKAGDRVRYSDEDGFKVGEMSLRKVGKDGNSIVRWDDAILWRPLEEFFSLWQNVEVWKEDDFVFDPDKRIDPDEPSNGTRAEWAEAALHAFLESTGEADVPDEANIRDLIADLLHLCDRDGIDGEAQVESALMNWRMER